jgi:hypothetical protein
VPLGPPSRPLGALLLAAPAPRAFACNGWLLHAASVAALQQLRQPAVEQMCLLLLALNDAPSPVAAVGVLLQVGAAPA